jgi:hypothetical protein
MTSPMAKMRGLSVRKSWSTIRRPYLPTYTNIHTTTSQSFWHRSRITA